MLKIGVLVSGSGSNLQSIIDAIENKYMNAEIEIVISNNKEAFALERAKKHNIENLYISKKDYPSNEDFDDIIISKLKEKEVDLVVLAGYLKILTGKFIRAFENRIINIHPSLIPSFSGEGFYGINVHREAIKKGVRYSGATVHFVNDIVDGGYIIEQEVVRVDSDDTAESLAKKVLDIEHKILVDTIKKISENKVKILNDRVYVED